MAKKTIESVNKPEPLKALCVALGCAEDYDTVLKAVLELQAQNRESKRREEKIRSRLDLRTEQVDIVRKRLIDARIAFSIVTEQLIHTRPLRSADKARDDEIERLLAPPENTAENWGNAIASVMREYRVNSGGQSVWSQYDHGTGEWAQAR